MPFHNHFFGFKSIKGLLITITGTKFKLLAMADLVLASVAAGLSVVPFVEEWIWSPMYTLLFYGIVLIADFCSGVMVGLRKRGEGFLTQKAQRLPIILAMHLVLLGIFHNLGKVNTDLGVDGIDEALFNGFARIAYFFIIGVNLASFIKNLTLLGYLKGAIAQFLLKYIDKQKNILDKHT